MKNLLYLFLIVPFLLNAQVEGTQVKNVDSTSLKNNGVGLSNLSGGGYPAGTVLTVQSDGGIKAEPAAIEPPVTIVRDVLSNGVDLPTPGTIPTGWYRVPAEFNGYNFTGVSYSFQNAGSGSGDAVIRIDKNGSFVHAGTLNVGDTQLNISGTGVTVATGDLLRVNVFSNSFSTNPFGMNTTMFFTKP